MIEVSSVAGIDTSKATLHVACGLGSLVRRFAKTTSGHRTLARVSVASKRTQLAIANALDRHDHHWRDKTRKIPPDA